MLNRDFWRDRPTLVTGATGLLGSALTRRLVRAGADVIALVRDWVPQSDLITSGILDRVKVARGNVQDQQFMERVLGEYEVDTVFHLAAQTIVSIANRNPISTFEANIQGTWSTLEACRRSSQLRQIVLASSDKAYGTQSKLPYTESTPLQGQHPYDVSKSCADLIAKTYHSTYRLPVCITRCGNFYGPGDLNWNRVVPGTIRAILRGQSPVIRSDGKFIRDYFYIEDGANAYMILAERMAADATVVGEAFNFSNEVQVTVAELVDKILAVANSDLRPVILNQVSNEIRHQFLDASKARGVLGWSPRYDLDQGLSETFHWYKTFFGQESGVTNQQNRHQVAGR